jgi:hypothetical protein
MPQALDNLEEAGSDCSEALSKASDDEEEYVEDGDLNGAGEAAGEAAGEGQGPAAGAAGDEPGATQP